MTQSSWPWDPGHTGSSITGLQYRQLSKTYGLRTPGVLLGDLNELAVYADSTGMRVKVPTGRAGCFGVIFQSDAEELLTIGANALGATRYDAIVVRFNFTAQTASLVVLTGTTSINGPTIAVSETGNYEIVLAYVAVPNGAVTIAASDVKLCADRWASHMGDDPVGSMLAYAGAASAVPKTYVVPQGQATTRWHYPKLWAIAPALADGGQWGKAANDYDLTLPDLRGRYPHGMDAMGGADGGRLNLANTLGLVGGEQLHTLTIAEIPPHAHEVLYGWNGVQPDGTNAPRSNSSTVHGSTQNQGGGGSHNNMPPYWLSTYMVKVA